MKKLILYILLWPMIALAVPPTIPSSITVHFGQFDAGNTIETAYNLYIGANAHVSVPTGTQWIIVSANVYIASSATIDGGGTILFDDPAKYADKNENVTWAGTATTLDAGNSKILANIVNRNPSNIILGAANIITSATADGITANTDHTLYIGAGFTWASVHGDGLTAVAYNDVLLGNNDLKFATTATESGYTQAGYAVTNGTGHVVKENYTGAWTFPVGKAESTSSGSDYTPAQITNTVANGMHILVQDYATSTADESALQGINRTWNIYADNASGNSLIDLQHNTATNSSSFDNSNQYVTRWSNTTPNTTGQTSISTSAWQSNNVGAGSNTGTLSSGSAITTASERNLNYLSFATIATDPIAYYSKNTNSAVLPLTLVNFTGAVSNCNTVLNWVTANEQNFSHFDVQFSTDGASFTKIGTVQGHNIATGSTYGFAYAAPQGFGIYRLAMIDVDGSTTYSGQVALTMNCNTVLPIVVYPNPTKGNVMVSGLLDGEQLVLYDATGRALLTKKINTANMPLDLSFLANGSYTVVVMKGEQRVMTGKVEKVK